MSQDRPVLGITLMLGFCVLAPMADALTKLTSNQVALGQFIFVRFLVQAVILIPMVAVTGRVWRMTRPVFLLALLRTVLHITGIGFMVAALTHLPLADAVAIAFVMPFIMLLLGHYVLGEEVGMRRMLACAVGFVGTLLVVQPAFQEVGWHAFWPLAAALNFAVFMLTTRKLAQQTDPIGLQAMSGCLALVILAPMIFLTPAQILPILAWDMRLGPSVWGLLLAIGMTGTVAHLLMTWSLRYAPAATLAPMQYLEIPVATVFGFAFFGEWPNPVAALGICIVMAAGLYIVFRERAIGRAPQPVPVAERGVQMPVE